MRILRTIDNLDQVKVNPAVFVDRVGEAINQALYDQAAEGIVYTPTGEHWPADGLHQSEIGAHDDVALVLELPTWFVIPTPLGDHHPDWAIVQDDAFLVRDAGSRNPTPQPTSAHSVWTTTSSAKKWRAAPRTARR